MKTLSHEGGNQLTSSTDQKKSGKLAKALGLVLLGLAVAGCETPAATAASQATIQVTTYEGRDLLCRVQPGGHAMPTYECDFAKFHADPSFVAPESIPRIAKDKFQQTDTVYQGGVLTCLIYGLGHASSGETCDFVEFEANQAAAAK